MTMTTPNRRPNTACDLCSAPMYRRPSTLAANAGKYCSTACRNKVYPHTGTRTVPESMMGENNPAWRGGSYIEPEKGYRMIRMPDHPRARQNGYVLEHIVVAERKLGRRLKPNEEVHHRDRDRANNDPDNLKVYDSHLEHWTAEHMTDVHAARDAAFSRRRAASARR